MLQNVIHLPVRGERPTRAGLFPRAEVSVCSATGNGSRGRNQGCFKRAVTMWSGRDSSLGSEWWRSERRTRPVAAGIVLSKTSPGGYRQVSHEVPGRVYRSRGARLQSTMTTGSPYVVRPGILQEGKESI